LSVSFFFVATCNCYFFSLPSTRLAEKLFQNEKKRFFQDSANSNERQGNNFHSSNEGGQHLSVTTKPIFAAPILPFKNAGPPVNLPLEDIEDERISSFVGDLKDEIHSFKEKFYILEKERISLVSAFNKIQQLGRIVMKGHFENTNNEGSSSSTPPTNPVSGFSVSKTDNSGLTPAAFQRELCFYQEKLNNIKLELQLKDYQILLLRKENELHHLKTLIYKLSHPQQFPPPDLSPADELTIKDSEVRHLKSLVSKLSREETTPRPLGTLLAGYGELNQTDNFSRGNEQAPIEEPILTEGKKGENVAIQVLLDLALDSAANLDKNDVIFPTEQPAKTEQEIYSSPSMPPGGSVMTNNRRKSRKESEIAKSSTPVEKPSEELLTNEVVGSTSVDNKPCELIPWGNIRCRVCGYKNPSKCVTCSEFFGVTTGICATCYPNHFQMIIDPQNRSQLHTHLDSSRKKEGLLPFNYDQLERLSNQVKTSAKKKRSSTSTKETKGKKEQKLSGKKRPVDEEEEVVEKDDIVKMSSSRKKMKLTVSENSQLVSKPPADAVQKTFGSNKTKLPNKSGEENFVQFDMIM
jgi:hypothetical protein